MAKNKIAGRLYLYLVQIVFITISGCNNDNNGQIRLEPLNKSTGENSISVEKSIPIIDIDTTDAEKINVPKDIFQSTLDFKKLIKEFHFAGLETNDKSIIGSINKILSDSVFYFIHDKDNNKIFRFNFQGKFLNQVGTTGNGPQEFVEAWDISLDKSNNLISVLDLKGRKIVRYTYDGRYIDSNPMYFFYTQHEYDNGYLILRTGKSNNISAPLVSSFELVIAHQNQVPIKKAFPFPKKMNSYTTENPLRKFNNTIYYHHPFSNFIWMVKNKNLDAPIKLSFQKNGWPDHIWLEGLDEIEFR